MIRCALTAALLIALLSAGCSSGGDAETTNGLEEQEVSSVIEGVRRAGYAGADEILVRGLAWAEGARRIYTVEIRSSNPYVRCAGTAVVVKSKTAVGCTLTPGVVEEGMLAGVRMIRLVVPRDAAVVRLEYDGSPAREIPADGPDSKLFRDWKIVTAARDRAGVASSVIVKDDGGDVLFALGFVCFDHPSWCRG